MNNTIRFIHTVTRIVEGRYSLEKARRELVQSVREIVVEVKYGPMLQILVKYSPTTSYQTYSVAQTTKIGYSKIRIVEGRYSLHVES